MEEIKIGGYRLLPKGEPFFSIALQENITLETDTVIEVTNKLIGNDTYYFGKIKLLLFNIPGYIPGLIDKANGEVSFNITKTTEYIIPKPNLNYNIVGHNQEKRIYTIPVGKRSPKKWWQFWKKDDDKYIKDLLNETKEKMKSPVDFTSDFKLSDEDIFIPEKKVIKGVWLPNQKK